MHTLLRLEQIGASTVLQLARLQKLVGVQQKVDKLVEKTYFLRILFLLGSLRSQFVFESVALLVQLLILLDIVLHVPLNRTNLSA